MSIESKIAQCVEIWIGTGSLPATPSSRNKKYNEILEKVLNGLFCEADLDQFIKGHEEGKYNAK